jgi:hypothetical protein
VECLKLPHQFDDNSPNVLLLVQATHINYGINYVLEYLYSQAQLQQQNHYCVILIYVISVVLVKVISNPDCAS